MRCCGWGTARRPQPLGPVAGGGAPPPPPARGGRPRGAPLSAPGTRGPPPPRPPPPPGAAPALAEPFLQAVRRTDGAALARIDARDPEAFREQMARTQNPTRICSVGCIYTLLLALSPQARPRRLAYHQAVTPEIANCVT